MFTESLRAQIDVVLTDYMRIRTRLKAPSRNIEHFLEEQNWVKTVPSTVKALSDVVQKIKYDYDILDYFWWYLSDQDFEAKWQAIGFPRQIQLHVRIVNRCHVKIHKCIIIQGILLNKFINIFK